MRGPGGGGVPSSRDPTRINRDVIKTRGLLHYVILSLCFPEHFVFIMISIGSFIMKFAYDIHIMISISIGSF